MKSGCRKISALILTFCFILSPSEAKKKKPSPPVKEEEFVADESQAVRIALPERKARAFFSSVDSDVVKKVQLGSPQSLHEAISYLRKKGDSASEAEKVLLYIAQSIMKICWQSENYTEPLVEISSANDYVGIIESVNSGIYDSNSSSTDFFAYALPPMVILLSDSKPDFYEDATASVSKALSMYSSSVFVNYIAGVLSEKTGDLKKAASFFDFAGKIAPDNFEINFSHARLAFVSKDYEKASSLANSLLETYGQNRQLLKLCAEIKYYSGNYEECESFVNRVLQIEPENRYFVLFRARLLIQKGEYIRAASLLDAYARIDTTSRDYLVLRFKVQKEWNRNVMAATSTIETALSLYPDDEEVIILAAGVASESGSTVGGKTGEELADLILEKDGSNIEALKIKISSMMQKRLWKEAYAISSPLASQKGIDRGILFNHINICLECGKKDEAWKIASSLYAENKNDEDFIHSYIHVLVSTGRGAEASRLIAQLLPSASSKVKSFLYYEKSFLESTEAAILTDLRSSLTSNPRNKDSLFRLYTIYFNKKEYRKAQYYLKQVVSLSPNDENLLVLNQNLEKLLK